MQTAHIQNLFILPYTSESDYKENVKSVLNFLKENIPPENVILTEGNLSKLPNRHDMLKYSEEYGLKYCNDLLFTSLNESNHKVWALAEYIINIGTWSPGVVSMDFMINHPNHTIIHIQGPMMPNYYKCDKVENLERCDTTLKDLMCILASQFPPQ